jgi:predicted ATPase
MAAQTIRTPDQRLRVFVSSTLQELADERRAARAGIERIHLAPVMFEAAARAHPPRDLYRAYLAQSDVFVGIYGARYGWVAPGMDISGLEDEYVLSAGMPRLVYVKSSGEREPRLLRMLERIEADDLSYKPFTQAAELAELVARDLALVLTERFAAAGEKSAGSEPDAAPPRYAPPAESGELIGRDRLLAEISERVAAARIVTLTGPGGTGKTSLAVRLAHGLAASFPDGVFYVQLAAVSDPGEVTSALCATLEIPSPPAGADPLKLVTGFLRTRRALLVLDNFEHVIGAARHVASLVAACPELTVLVTSRSPLRVRGESEIPVPPLMVAGDASAIQLFEARAREVRPTFEVTDENRAAVTAICRRLDGLPLAIELAAARIRVLTPQAMLPRLDRSLGLLTGGAQDLPERHRTLRGALEWSYELLPPRERVALCALGVCAGTFGIETAAAVLDVKDDLEVLDLLGSLVDKSLLVRAEMFDEPRFHLLETVREFALERLTAEGGLRDAELRVARWVRAYVAASLPRLSNYRDTREYERFLIDSSQVSASIGWALGPDGDLALGWSIVADYLLILQTRMRTREIVQLFDRAAAVGPCVDEVSRLKAEVARGSVAVVLYDTELARSYLPEAGVRLRALGERQAAGWADALWAQGMLLLGLPGAEERLDLAEADAIATGDANGKLYILLLRSYFAFMAGDLERVRALALQGIDEALKHREADALTSHTAMLARVHLARGDLDTARDVFANAAALGREGGAVWGQFDALSNLASVVLAQEDRAAAVGILEEGIRVGRVLGLGTGLELMLGALGGLAARDGEADRAVLWMQLVPDGYEERPPNLMTEGIDPTGAMRVEIREARRILGPRARAAADPEAIFDEVVDRALGR